MELKLIIQVKYFVSIKILGGLVLLYGVASIRSGIGGQTMGLMDADKLLELIKDQKEREIGAYAKGINAGLNIVKSIINDETQTPTAYDVDKVVEQLKTDSLVKLYGSGNSDNYLIPVKRAIEIVKAGGIDER